MLATRCCRLRFRFRPESLPRHLGLFRSDSRIEPASTGFVTRLVTRGKNSRKNRDRLSVEVVGPACCANAPRIRGVLALRRDRRSVIDVTLGVLLAEPVQLEIRGYIVIPRWLQTE
jgi:hypothetical protein